MQSDSCTPVSGTYSSVKLVKGGSPRTRSQSLVKQVIVPMRLVWGHGNPIRLAVAVRPVVVLVQTDYASSVIGGWCFTNNYSLLVRLNTFQCKL